MLAIKDKNYRTLNDSPVQVEKDVSKQNKEFLNTYYKYQDFRERAYNLIPAFKPTNDYLKRILKNAKKAKKISAKESSYGNYHPYEAY